MRLSAAVAARRYIIVARYAVNFPDISVKYYIKYSIQLEIET